MVPLAFVIRWGTLRVSRRYFGSPRDPSPPRLASHELRMMRVLPTLLIAAAIAQPLKAQDPPSGHWASEDWMGEVTFASANALLAGLSAGLLQVIRKGSFKHGFATGALGGAVVYAGRRLAVEDFPGAGLMGRQVSAVGSSVTRNAGDGNPVLSRVWLPLGPLLLRVDTNDGVSVSPLIDLYALAWLTAAGFDNRLAFDGRATISSGAPVFQVHRHRLRHDGRVVGGQSIAGLILLDQTASADHDGETLGHERVHVLQYDFAQLVWNDPAEDYLLGSFALGRAIGSVARVGVLGPAISGGLDGTVPSLRELWEAEAYFLDGR